MSEIMNQASVTAINYIIRGECIAESMGRITNSDDVDTVIRDSKGAKIIESSVLQITSDVRGVTCINTSYTFNEPLRINKDFKFECWKSTGEQGELTGLEFSYNMLSSANLSVARGAFKAKYGHDDDMWEITHFINRITRALTDHAEFIHGPVFKYGEEGDHHVFTIGHCVYSDSSREIGAGFNSISFYMKK